MSQNPLRLLAKLRRFPEDGDIETYLRTEHRQNLKAIEDALRRLGVTLDDNGEPVAAEAVEVVASSVVFTASGSWTCPDGVTEIGIEGCGGGSGGQIFTGGSGNADGGWGAPYNYTRLRVTPGSTYTITIGAGGGSTGDGSATTFSTSLGAIITFLGASPVGGVGYQNDSPFFVDGSNANYGGVNGLGGGGGPYGVGANGGAGSSNISGGNAGANTGAGGGGGAGNAGTQAGGLGGSGKLTIYF